MDVYNLWVTSNGLIPEGETNSCENGLDCGAYVLAYHKLYDVENPYVYYSPITSCKTQEDGNCLACEDGYKLSDNKCTQIINDNCATFTGEECTTCKTGFTGEECNTCATGYSGENCSGCDDGYKVENN